ncbi:penicillin acylase family protein [Micromonospora sp. M71_S20]|uniref:penicillin acylase family protein n=1 Tax=Micromonospora sp. M71_S20 TaxID=592872 RepID=UPI0013159E8C|nr:penicillin acylase family protein [Micromonospora sp. M71_S20]
MCPDRDGRVVEGAPWRFVVEFGPSGSTRIRDDDLAVVGAVGAEQQPRHVLRHGSSGNPLSPHYGDQTPAHAEGRLYEVRLDSPPQVRSRLTLTPRTAG